LRSETARKKVVACLRIIWAWEFY